MRLELALIVGILFFCSWCAYIVARMNSSVSTSESSSSSLPLQTTGNQANWTSHSGLVQDPYQQLSNHTYLTSQLPSARHQAQQQHHFGASEPEGAWQHQQQQQMGAQAPHAALAVGPQVQQQQQAQPGVFYQRPNLGPISPPEAGAPTRWHTYALPTRLSVPNTPDTNQFGPAPELIDSQAEQLDQDERQIVDAPTGESTPGDYEDEDTAASDYVTPLKQAEEAGEEGDEPINEQDQEENAGPETGNELDEVSQRRVFNELESDSTERDKNGNLLSTRRRHLINGKPVSARSRTRQPAGENDENNYAESARHNSRAEARAPSHVNQAQEADFERLVGEFEREDELRKLRAAGKLAEVAKSKVGPTSGQLAHHKRLESGAAEGHIKSNINGRPKWSVAEKLMRRTGAGGFNELGAWEGRPARVAAKQAAGVQTNAKQIRRLKKAKQKQKKKDEHEHRLQETLEQQQWDDDAATSVDERPKNEPEASDDDEKVSDIVEQDEEARQLEDLSQELMLNPQFAELTRRRRSIQNEFEDEAGSSPADGGNEPHDAECERDCDVSSDFQERSRDEGPDDAQEASETGAQVESVDPEVAIAARLRANEAVPAPLMLHSSGAQQQTERLSDVYEPLERSVTKEPLEHRAESAVEKVAPSNRSQTIVSEIGSTLTRGLHMTQANSTPSEEVSGMEDMHVEVLAQPPFSVGLNNFSAPLQQLQPLHPAPATPIQPSGPTGLVEFPRVASPFASGSSKVGKKKKKKSHKYSKKRSKLIDSKYKAAQAYAKKQRSKQKKGQMRKKKRKSEKKLIAGAKHFAGSTRGHKKALGRGIKGARKGSTYLKDKGYKKKGFKKAYHKLETGDHKTYFDEFRDKDHNKKWKDFDDKHKYSQRKKWAGNDVRHLKHHDLKEARGKASKSGRWKESAMSKHMKKAKKYKKANKVAKKSYSSEAKKKKKKKKKKMGKEKH